MIKIHTGIAICILGLLVACTPHQFLYSPDNEIPLNDLVNHLPVTDSIESTLIYNAILAYGEEGVVEISKQLESENQQNQIQARWALNGLAVYVTDKRREAQRESYVLGLKKALNLSLNSDNKVFIINQFQIAGGNESVSILSAYLDDPILFEPAIQALTVIGSESAGEVLLNALPTAAGKQKVALIRALGTMQYEPACERIILFLNDSNISIQKSSAFALSNSGYSPAKMPLSMLVQNDSRYVSSYLRLAERLGEKGDVGTCLSICNEILKNENDYYSDNNKINALSLFALYNPAGVKDYFFEILSKNNKRMRVAVLNLVDNYGTPDMVSEIIILAPDKSFDVQTEIIEILGRKKSDSVNLFLRESLKSPSSGVRLSAIKALAETRNLKEIPELLTVMQDSLDEKDSNQFQSILLSNADSSEIDYLMEYFYDFSFSSRIVLLDILSGRGNNAYQTVYLESLNANYSPLRLAAMKALQICGNDSSLNEMVLYLLNSENEKEKKVAIQTISSLINRSQTKNKQIKLLKNYYDKATNNKKILFFSIFKNVGGNEFMSILVMETQSKDELVREEALQNLSEWPDPDALNILIDIGQNAQSKRNRIIALRGALRILIENPMGDQRALSYYKEIMNVVARPEERRQILAGLAEIRTASSLTLISSFLHDPEINQEAFLAALKVSSKSEGEVDYLRREEIVISLIESQSDDELVKKIKIYTQDQIRKPQPPEGFSALFNGINLIGWKGLVKNPVKRTEMSDDELRKAQTEADKVMNKHWQVIDGILYFDGKGSHLCTVNDYTDYELFVDWKIEKEGDSGIYLRGAPQVQIWDPAKGPEGSGGLYNNQKHPDKPLQKADNPVGAWNTFHIIMRGEKVTVFLNDIHVVDDVVMENYWERDRSIYTSGQIELQSHSTPLYFKNIFIRELEPIKP